MPPHDVATAGHARSRAKAGAASAHDRLDLLRKGLHALSSLFMLMYLLPEDFLGFNRGWLLMAPFVVFIVLELYRVSRRRVPPMMREYERRQVSGFVWAGATLVLSLLLFPPRMVVPVYVCWAWLDPLCSLLRGRWAMYPLLPFALYVALFMLLTRLPGLGPVVPFGIAGELAAAALVGAIALVLEHVRLRGFNDDFLMVFGPLLALSIFDELVSLAPF